MSLEELKKVALILGFKKYLDHGINDLNEGNHTRRPNKLTTQQLEAMTYFIHENTVSATGGRLQAKDVQSFLLNNILSCLE